MSNEAGLSDGFFRFYWLTSPARHPYDLSSIEGYREAWRNADGIQNQDHLRWGLLRFYTDALMYFGNIRQAYRELRTRTFDEIEAIFNAKGHNATDLARRGPPLPFRQIKKDDRYLISEMACKSYAPATKETEGLLASLLAAFDDHKRQGGGRVRIRALLDGSYKGAKPGGPAANQMHLFSAEEILDEEVASAEDIRDKYTRVATTFAEARQAALENTRLYLSMMNDLDVYVATSMRRRADFRDMADKCDRIFGHRDLKELHLRYFDPTLSACDGHEDKGLIECLAVKCAKVLVYCAGEKESYGKDAEAAMALSQGKPVIFLCDEEQRSRFYREVHPLSRLIDFETGIAVGAMVTTNVEEVSQLLLRLFSNRMQYELEQPKAGYLRLKERLTKSVVRLQTADPLLRETFWNHYHNRV